MSAWTKDQRIALIWRSSHQACHLTPFSPINCWLTPTLEIIASRLLCSCWHSGTAIFSRTGILQSLKKNRICFLYDFYLHQPEITMKNAVLQTVDVEDEPWPACEGLQVPLVAADPRSGFSGGSSWTAPCLTRHLRPICLQEGQNCPQTHGLQGLYCTWKPLQCSSGS